MVIFFLSLNPFSAFPNDLIVASSAKSEEQDVQRIPPADSAYQE
jgi:hypothetical protein